MNTLMPVPLLSHRRFPAGVALSLVLATFFAFGLFHIDRFITADEHYWLYERIPEYWDALHQGNWKKTLINDKPGVSLALVSGAGLLFDAHPETLCQEDEIQVDRCDTGRTSSILLSFRLPLLILNTFLLFLIFHLLSKLYSDRIALLATSLIAFSPILVGITQIVNPDALLWSFGTSALLSFLVLLKLREKKYVFLTGVLFGFALLSKYTAGFLVPFFVLLIFTDTFFQGAHQTETLPERIRNNILFLLGVLGTGILITLFFLPAIWSKPELLEDFLSIGNSAPLLVPLSFLLLGVSGIILQKKSWRDSIIRYADTFRILPRLEKTISIFLLVFCVTLIIGRICFPEWTTFEKIPFDLKDLYSSDKPDKTYYPNPLETIFLEMNPLVFSLTPILLILFLFRLLSSLLPKKHAADDTPTSGRFEDFSLLMFVFLFLFAMLFSEVLATARYLILLYPAIAILAASGVRKSAWYLGNFGLHQTRRLLAPGIILSALASTALAAPFYFNYTNFFLPREKVIHHSWGLGGYEAAQYLNSLPNADRLLIWSDYYGVCEFFRGRCLTLEYEAAAKQRFDYAVLSSRGKSLYRPEHSRWKKTKNLQMSAAYADPNPDWQLLIDDRERNFVKVVKMDAE